MKTLTHIRKNSTGAALMIALLAAVVVMMAATLLISLTRRMVNSYLDRLNNAQISLSESSAADGLSLLLSQSGPGAANGDLQFDLAGVSTEFTLLETGTAGIRTGFFQLDNVFSAVVVPAGSHLVTLQGTGDSCVQVTFFSSDTFNPTTQFTIETDMRPVAGTPFVFHGEEAVIAVFEGAGITYLACFSSDGIQAGTVVDSDIYRYGSMISAGEAPDGSPLLIVTGGSNLGAVFNCETGEFSHVGSPAGTCPVFLSDGTMFGSVQQSFPSFGGAHIEDVFGGDFNNDGMPDVAFATRFSLSVYSGATHEIIKAGPGGSLVSWGSVEGRTGLCGMWKMPSGDIRWLRLAYDGFTDFNPDMVYELGWQGRFNGRGNTLTGIIDDSAVIASSTGYVLELLTGDVFTGNADGGEIDFFRIADNGVEACFNPVNGDGIQMTFSTQNRYRGETTPGETYTYSIYESEGRLNVFHALEGLGR